MNPWLLLAIPVAAALIGLVVVRDEALSRAVAICGGGITLLAGLSGWVAVSTAYAQPGPGLDAGGLQVPLDLVGDPTRWAIVAVVALVAAAVQVHAAWYLGGDDRYGSFAATVSLFTAAMLLVVVSGDLLLTVVGWEVMGWCSYLLIGHWSRRHSARRAAHKAFIVTRVADVGFVLGVVGLAAGAGSTRLADVIAAWDRPTECIDAQVALGAAVGDALATCNAPDGRLRALLLTLLVIGVLGKSAQVPFQDWLADAMEGPTPASALIHAATMVAAGTVVLASVFPLLSVSQTPRWVLGISVSVTMVLAGILAFAQSDLKRLLAWSTVSQVAVMLSALAAAPPAAGAGAGLFHLWSHALFKALLFLAIGWAGLVVGGTAATALRGSAAAAPLLRVSFLVGLVSLAGVPLVVGGISKEHVLSVAWEGAVDGGPGILVLLALIASAAITAAYCTRAYLILTAHVREVPKEPTPPIAVRVALWTLTVLSVVGGLVLVVTDAFALGSASLLWILLTALLIAAGVVFALRGGLDRDPAEVMARRLVPHADRGLGADALYRRLVADPVVRLARVVAFVDTEVIDAYVRGTAVAAKLAGWGGARAHRGERPSSAVALVVGAVVVLGVTGVVLWS